MILFTLFSKDAISYWSLRMRPIKLGFKPHIYYSTYEFHHKKEHVTNIYFTKFIVFG